MKPKTEADLEMEKKMSERDAADKKFKEELEKGGIYPDKSCKKCYGRGYIGINVLTNEMIPCRCLYKATFKKFQEELVQKQIQKENNTIKEGEFKGYQTE